MTTTEKGHKSTTWLGALLDAVNDIDIIGGELSYRVSDLYDHQGVTGRQRRSLIGIASRAQKLLDDLALLRRMMDLPERPTKK